MNHPTNITTAEADKWFTLPSELNYSCDKLDILLEHDKLEIAVAGRSNVGKSSLINALLGRKNLAYTSNTPGRTQLLNFISVANEDIYIVDMPGYGYAKIGKKKRREWKRLIFGYLQGRVNLRRVLLLVDSRLGLTTLDKDAIKIFDEAAVNFQIVLTKSDKIPESNLTALVNQTEEFLKTSPAGCPKVVCTSIRKPETISNLRDVIWKFINLLDY